MLKERRSNQHPDSVATTWQVSFKQVEATNAAPADLLRLCSFLAPDAIAEWLALQAMVKLGEKRNTRGWSFWWQEEWWRARRKRRKVVERGLDEAIEALRAYSLLKRDAQNGILSMHRLVQAVVRDAMTEEEEYAWKQRVMLFLREACPDVSKFEEWPRCEQWVSHALVSVRWLEEAALQTEVAAWVCNQAGYLSFVAIPGSGTL